MNQSLCVDTHTHLTDSRFDHDRKQIIDRMDQDGIEFCVEIGSSLKSSQESMALAYTHSKIYACIGVHPHNAKDVDPAILNELKQLARLDRCVGIGEIGLDFYRDLSPRDTQMKVFLDQLEIAKAVDLPVVVHIRDAYEPALSVLKQTGIPKKGGIIHSFSAGWAQARRLLDLGWHLGISGPVTYPKNKDLREVVQRAPLDRLVSETDCPYLPPVPFRGKRNEPQFVHYVVDQIITLRNESKDEVVGQLIQNARTLFPILD